MTVTATTVISTVTLIKDSLVQPFSPVEASEGVPPYSYEITGVLPNGIGFNTSTGVFSGTPTQVTNFSYDITVTDSNSDESTASFRLVVQSEIIPYLERIAGALERISTDTQTIASISTTTGIRTEGAYDWTRPVDVYSWYNQDLTTLITNTSTVVQLVSNASTITDNLPKFL